MRVIEIIGSSPIMTVSFTVQEPDNDSFLADVIAVCSLSLPDSIRQSAVGMTGQRGIIGSTCSVASSQPDNDKGQCHYLTFPVSLPDIPSVIAGLDPAIFRWHDRTPRDYRVKPDNDKERALPYNDMHG